LQIGFICSLTFASLKCQTAEVLKKDCRFYCRPHRRSVGNEGLGKLQTFSRKQFHLWESFKLSAGSNFILGKASNSPREAILTLGKLQTFSGKQFHLWESFKLSAGSKFILGKASNSPREAISSLGKLQTLRGKQFHLWESFKLLAGSNFIFGKASNSQREAI
jgi:predicted Zn-dependent protease